MVVKRRSRKSELETHVNVCKHSFEKDIYIALEDKAIINSKKSVLLEHMLIYLHLHNGNQNTNRFDFRNLYTIFFL